MIDTARWLSEASIEVPRVTPGNYKTKCPRCQHTRRKGKTDRPLSVEIRDDGFAVWDCHHCGWYDHTPSEKGTKPMKRAKKPTVKPVWDGAPTPNRKLLDYFAKRGISENTVTTFDLRLVETWMPHTQREEWCIAFPYKQCGEVVNIKYRTADKNFKQVKDAEKILYNIDAAHPEAPTIIVEGEIDVLSLVEAGFFNVISVPNGAPSEEVKDGPVDPEHDDAYEYLWNCKEQLDAVPGFILATDNDPKGRALEAELARRLGKHRCKRVIWPEDCKDANDVLVKHGKQKLIELVMTAQPYPISGLFQVRDFYQEVVDAYEGRLQETYDLGWQNLDLRLSTDGLLIVVTGIPNHGKSTFIDQMLLNLALRHGWSSALCSFENPPVIHIQKLLCQYVGKAFKTTNPRWRMTPEERDEGQAYLDRYFFPIRAEDESPTIDWVIEKATAAVFRHGIKALVIDPYNEIEHTRGSLSETDYISLLLSKLKRFAQNYGIAVFIVAHPTKIRPLDDGTIPPPTLYDISGSANWANKADIGIVVYRNPATGAADILVKKVRWDFLGEPSECTLYFDKVSLRFADELTVRPIDDRKAYERDDPPWH